VSRALALVLAIAGCGERDRDPAPAPEPPPPRSAGVAAPAASTVATDWMVRLADQPVVTMFRTAGPVIAGDRVVVGSTAIGFAAVDAASGKVAWRVEGEAFPYRIMPQRSAPERILVTGRCSHLPDARPGKVCTRHLRLADGGVAADSWGHGYDAEEAIVDRPGVSLGGRETRAEIQDQALSLVPSPGHEGIDVPGRFVDRPGALGQTDRRSRTLVALRVEPMREAGGSPVIHPVWIDFDSGVITRSGADTTGDGVVAADIAATGVAAVVRFGRDLKRHQVVLWGPDGALRWRWDLPAPQQARVDLSVAVGDDAVYVFFDGRDLARLPLPTPTPGAARSDAGPPTSENPTP
jgi:hypothetical protein